MIKAVMFDMDDTLLHLDVDWNSVHKGMAQIIQEHKGDYNVDICVDLIHYSNTGIGEKLTALVDDYESRGWDESYLLPHAKEVVEALAQQYKIAVVTGNGLFAAKKALEKHGLMEFISVLATREDGIKPEAQPVIKALERLECTKDEAVFVGNSRNDMIASKAAGVRAIGYTSNHTAEELKSHGADTIINDLREIKALIE